MILNAPLTPELRDAVARHAVRESRLAYLRACVATGLWVQALMQARLWNIPLSQFPRPESPRERGLSVGGKLRKT